MKYLIGDIGNTFTKICILNDKFAILKSYQLETDKISKSNYLNRIITNKLKKNLNPVFLFSSVVPKVFKGIKKKFKNCKI